MFIIHTLQDTVLIHPAQLALPTTQAIHNEIDHRYPNRVLMDVGLVICRYGDSLESVSHGVCVAGQAGAHHHCKFRLIVFRPFVEEVCLGRIHRSTEQGIYVTVGFFEDIFIPAYWMLRPSIYEASSGLWVWTPEYGEEEEDDAEKEASEKNGSKSSKSVSVKQEPDGEQKTKTTNGNVETVKNEEEEENGDGGGGGGDDNRYEMEIGSEIRFKVKSIHFTRITNSAKGRQAVVSTTDKPVFGGSDGRSKSADKVKEESLSQPSSEQRPVRQRSSSVGLEDDTALPPTMYIVASICDDGLGLTSWWGAGEGDEDTQEGAEEEGADEMEDVEES